MNSSIAIFRRLISHSTCVGEPMNVILEDLKSQREGLLGLGFWALLVYRFGHARLAIRNKLLRLPFTIIYLFLNKLIEIFCGIVIGANAKIGRRLSFEHHGCIVIHGATQMGDDCMIRHGVTIGNAGKSDPKGAPTIGNRVEIGAGAKVLGRITIGNGVIIGANAVVTRDIPDNAVAVGIPAKVIKIQPPLQQAPPADISSSVHPSG